jgi:UDP-GlcNAc:undecaprenyl-phosphate GlcNAc-1-phosphate transferase
MITIFSILFLNNLLIFIYLKKFSKFINIFDKPDKYLKKHKSNVPLLGGIIILINLMVFFFLLLFFENPFQNLEISKKEYISVFIFIISFFFLGLYDDRFKLNPDKKFVLSIILFIFIITLNKNLLIENFNLSFFDRTIALHEFSFFFTLFCVLILINALNFYDGINGQSLMFFILVFGYLSLQSPLKIFYFILIFICAFILILNLQNKIFLGDGGIYLLGSILIVLLIYEYKVFKTIKFADEIFLLLILPGVDLLRLTIMRIIKGKNAFYGDRNHIHHLFTNRFSLTFSNTILLILSILPITLLVFFKLNFFKSFIIFLMIYIFSIKFLKSNSKKNNLKKK